jgi:cytochrome P460
MVEMRKIALTAAGLAYIAATVVVADQQRSVSTAVAPSSEAPRYTNGSNLIRPADYREWVFLSSGLGMDYTPPRGAQNSPRFGNVFVNPSSYREFTKTGKWPDKTTFVLEFRASTSEGSINKAGRFQAQLVGVEAEVKDSKFSDGWAFFNFGQGSALADSAAPLPVDAGCVECHTKNTAVERTFVQFYPTLLDVARKMKTVKPGF